MAPQATTEAPSAEPINVAAPAEPINPAALAEPINVAAAEPIDSPRGITEP
jgi:hypothetical protein